MALDSGRASWGLGALGHAGREDVAGRRCWRERWGKGGAGFADWLMVLIPRAALAEARLPGAAIGRTFGAERGRQAIKADPVLTKCH